MQMTADTNNQQKIQNAAVLLSSDDWSKRKQAVDMLGETNESEAIDYLTEALSDEYWVVRIAATRALASMDDPRVQGPLISVLINDDKPKIKRCASQALEEKFPYWPQSDEAKQWLPQFIKSLTRGVSQDAIVVLQGVNPQWKEVGKTQLPVFLQSLKKGNIRAVEMLDLIDPNWTQTNAAREILPDLLDIVSNLAVILIYKYSNEDQYWYRDFAAEFESKYPNAITRKSNVVIFEEFIQLVGRFNDISVVSTLIAYLNYPNSFVRPAVVEALVLNTKDTDFCSEAVQQLIERLQNCDGLGAPNIAKTLGQLGDESAIGPLLVSMGKTKSWTCHNIVISSLNQLNSRWVEDKSVQQSLEALLNQLCTAGRGKLRAKAALALNALMPYCSPIPIPDKLRLNMIVVLRDKDSLVSTTAGKILEQSWPEWPQSELAVQQVPEFVSALTDKNSKVAASSFKALEKINPHWTNDDGAVQQQPELIPLLVSNNRSLQQSALKALARINAEWMKSDDARAMVPQLLEALKGKRPGVCGAISALQNIVPEWQESELLKQQIPEIIAALRSNNKKVRQCARNALDKLDPSWFKTNEAKAQLNQFISTFYYGETPGLRQTAEQVLEKINSNWQETEANRLLTPVFSKGEEKYEGKPYIATIFPRGWLLLRLALSKRSEYRFNYKVPYSAIVLRYYENSCHVVLWKPGLFKSTMKYLLTGKKFEILSIDVLSERKGVGYRVNNVEQIFRGVKLRCYIKSKHAFCPAEIPKILEQVEKRLDDLPSGTVNF